MRWFDCDVEKIDDHLYLIIPPKSGNIGLCIIEQSAMIIDSGYSPRRSATLVDFIEDKFDCRIELLFNTHYHADHTFGNQSFDCPIMASKACRDTMNEIVDSHWSLEEIEKAKKDDPALVDDWADLKITPPNEVFEGIKEIKFHGLQVVFSVMGGHTSGSSIISFPEKRVVYSGDLVFEDAYPTLLMHDESPEALIDALHNLMVLDVNVIVPGHGSACAKSTVTKLITYWQCLMSECSALVGEGQVDDDIVEIVFKRCRLDAIEFNEFKHKWNIKRVLKSIRNNPE